MLVTSGVVSLRLEWHFSHEAVPSGFSHPQFLQRMMLFVLEFKKYMDTKSVSFLLGLPY